MTGGESLFSTSAGTLALVALIMALLALAGAVFMLARQQRILGQYQHLMTGTSGGNLEELLNDHVSQVHDVATQSKALEELAHRLEQESYYHLQHLSIVRFNPFHNTGGDQSFAIVLADGLGNGVVLSSLHARDVTRVYAKPLEQWSAIHTLTEEEEKAISLAQQQRG
jgi:hypothetical protein